MLNAGELRLFLTTDAVGGVWTYSLELAAGLADLGVSTTLAVLGPSPTRDQIAQARSVSKLTVLDTGLPLDWVEPEPALVQCAADQLARLSLAHGADIIHLHSGAYAAGAYRAPVVVSCHSCVATWWRALRDGPMPADFLRRSELVSRGYEAADRLLAPSAAFARATAEAHGLRSPPDVVANGRRIAFAPSVPGARASHVFAAGRLWDDAKDIATLDRAAEHILSPVRVAGQTRGPHGVGVSLAHAEALGVLGENVMAAHLARQPVFVSTARYEPFGLAVLEAAAAGCALVLSDIPTFRELWDGAALFAPAGDPIAFASLVNGLFAAPEERDRLGRLAQDRAKIYGRDGMARKVSAVYRELLGLRALEFGAEAAE